MRLFSSLQSAANPLPATFMRGGTSKGIFINRANLPEDRSQWGRIFLGIMGSPDPEYGRQLNGMGGGISSLSKICVVGPASPERKAEGIDIEYTFIQVGIRDSVLDYSGNCGNLSSMIGVFAVDEGIHTLSDLDKKSPNALVRSFNLNTNKRIDTTFPVGHGPRHLPVLDLEQTTMAGVPGKASQIVLDFVSPGGARTGKLLPTGYPTNDINFHFDNTTSTVPASLVDATNPTVFVALNDIRASLSKHKMSHPSTIDYSVDSTLSLLEEVRREGAKLMGLDSAAQAQPKIAILSYPSQEDSSVGVDIVVHALSMGVLHKAVPMTVGLGLGVAAGIKGTLAWDIVRARPHVKHDTSLIRIRHPSGVVDVGAEFLPDGSVKSAKVIRTGRRLMKGVVWW